MYPVLHGHWEGLVRMFYREQPVPPATSLSATVCRMRPPYIKFTQDRDSHLPVGQVDGDQPPSLSGLLLGNFTSRR